jgi:predicted site-specific integrase-resolvase
MFHAKYSGFSVYKDVASGLTYKRKGLQRLLGHCQEGVVETVTHRDRLARFGVEII